MTNVKVGDFIKFKNCTKHMFSSGLDYSGFDYKGTYEVVYVYKSGIGVRVKTSKEEQGSQGSIILPEGGYNRHIDAGDYVVVDAPINHIRRS